MSISASCPGCGHTTRFKDDSAGKKAACRQCGVVFFVASGSGTPKKKPATPASDIGESSPVADGEFDFELLSKVEREGKAVRPAAPLPSAERKKKAPRAPEVGWTEILLTPFNGELWGKAAVVALFSICWSFANGIGLLVCVLPGLIGMLYQMGWLFTRMADVCSEAARADTQPEENSVGTVLLICLIAAFPLIVGSIIADAILGVSMKSSLPVVQGCGIVAAIALVLGGFLWFALYVPMSIATYSTTGSVSMGATYRYFTLCFSDRKWLTDLVLWWLFSGFISMVFAGLCVLVIGLTGAVSTLRASTEFQKAISGVTALGLLLVCNAAITTILMMANFINVQSLGLVLRRNRESLGYGSRPFRSRETGLTASIPTADNDL